METTHSSGAGSAKHSGPLMRLVKTKFLNILVVVVLIVCLILFMRDGSAEDKIKTVETGVSKQTQVVEVDTAKGKPEDIEDYDESDEDEDLSASDDEEDDFDVTTTHAIVSTTPYFTTAGAKIHLHKDGSKMSTHTDFLKVGGYNLGTIKLDHLNNYRNPCFFEEREDTNVVIAGVTYRNNPFREKEPFMRYFENLKKMVIRSHEELCGDKEGCRLRCLPYFIVLGMAERETHDFFKLLSQHQQVHAPIVPEISFWHKYRFTNTNFNDYLDLYDNATSTIHKQVFSPDATGKHIYLDVTGELSPIAMMADHSWKEDPRNEDLLEPYTLLTHDLHSVIPSLKLILLLRDPVSHIYWHYNNAPYGKEKTPEEFHTRVNNSMIWWGQCVAKFPVRACVYGTPPDMEKFEDRTDNTWWPKSSRFIGALRDGLYFIYITDYLKVFPRDSLLVLRSEDFVDKPTESFTKQVFPFLDLAVPTKNTTILLQSQQVTDQDKYKPMLPETYELLSKFYGGYNDKLADLLQDDKFLWKDTKMRIYKKNV